MTKRIEIKQGCFLDTVKDNILLQEDFIFDSINVRDEYGKSALYWALKHQNRENIKMLLEQKISLIVFGNYHALTYSIDCNLCDIFIEIAKKKEGKESLFLFKDIFVKRAKIKKCECIMGYLSTL